MTYAFRLLLALAWSTPLLADPLDVSLGLPAETPAFVGLTTTLPITVESTLSTGTVTGISAVINSPLLAHPFDYVSDTCPGTMVQKVIGGLQSIEWTGMGDVSGSQSGGGLQSIGCEVVLRPIVNQSSLVLLLQMDCASGCESPPDNRSQLILPLEQPPNVSAEILVNEFPSLGINALTVRLQNVGPGIARNINVALFGDSGIFTNINNTGVGDCASNAFTQFDSAGFSFDSLDPGELLDCPFTFELDSAGQYALNLSALAESPSGRDDPWPDNNSDSKTLTVTDIQVDSRFSSFPDQNPGDGICEDQQGNCTLRAAVDEANALPNRQTITVPYQALGYHIGGLGVVLEVTDPVTIVGIPNPDNGALPWITRGDNEDVSLIVLDHDSSSESVLRYLDLRGRASNTVSVDGAVVHQKSGQLWIRESLIRNGKTTGNGGGIRGTQYLRLSGVEVYDNQATAGGGLAIIGLLSNEAQDLFIEGSSFHDNTAIHANANNAVGGAIWGINARATIERSSFTENSAGRGGAIFTAGGSDFHLVNSTISTNIADLEGGGIFHGAGPMSLDFVTLVHNEAGPGSLMEGSGGGVYMDNGQQTRVVNSIIAYNKGRSSNGGPLGFRTGAECFGTFNSFGYNSFLSTAQDSECGVAGNTAQDELNAFPKLSDLVAGNNALRYHHLTAVGTEVDQADVTCENSNSQKVTLDIRRKPRPMEGDASGEAVCDRGAVEASPVTLNIDVTETGPADWSIDFGDVLDACTQANCDYYGLAIGQSLTLTPVANGATSFDGWGGACSSFGTSACTIKPYLFTEVTAAFTSSATSYTLSATVNGNGSISSNPAGIACPGNCSEDYAENTEVTLTATPDPGHVFEGWSGDCTGTGSCQVTLGAARSVIATFVASEDMIFSSSFE